MNEISETAAKPRIGIAFMAGADPPQVNRMEQFGMTRRTPEQKSALWRVNTAGTLLNDFEVDTDLSTIWSLHVDEPGLPGSPFIYSQLPSSNASTTSHPRTQNPLIIPMKKQGKSPNLYRISTYCPSSWSLPLHISTPEVPTAQQDNPDSPPSHSWSYD